MNRTAANRGLQTGYTGERGRLVVTLLWEFRMLHLFRVLIGGLGCSWILVSWVMAQDHGGAWRAGLGRAVITPTQPLWMAGYAARTGPAEGQVHDLWAKALVLEEPAGGRLLLVTLDLLGIDRDLSERVGQRLQDELGWERERVAICCSHTHSGPVVGDVLLGMYPLDTQQRQWTSDYTRWLEDRLVEVARQATESLEPMQVGWASGSCSFAVNRRSNPESEVVERRATDRLVGPVDHQVPVLVLRNMASEVRGLVFGYACHATVLSDQQWCGDWPGFAQLELEARFPQAQAMFVAGCGGDQNPLPRRSLELAATYGQQLAESVQRAVQQRVYPIQGPVAARLETVALPFQQVPARETLQAIVAAVEAGEPDAPNRYEVARAIRLLEQYERDGAVPDRYPYPLQTWQLGDGPTWVFLGGEVVVDYALRLKQMLGTERTWVAAYANDVMAYIPSERVLQEGGYEGGGAMVYYGLPSPWQAGLEDRICVEVERQAVAVKQERNRGWAYDLPVSGHDPRRLLYYLDEEGHEQPVVTPADWERRRVAILRGMQQLMGPLPDRTLLCELDVREVSRESFEGYVRVELSYAAEPGDRVSADLYLPEASNAPLRRPAVLALHQTSALGKRDVGIDGKPDRTYAHELALRGYIVLAPDYPSFGDLANYDFANDRYASGTMKGIFNHLRAVDLLVARDDVDPDRLGVIGHSLGGHNALFVAAFEPRLKVIVTSCGWTPFHFYYGGKKLENWAQDRYMPWMRDVFHNDPEQVPCDFHEIVAALAPRTFFSCSPTGDENFEVAGVQQVETAVREVYRLFGAEDELIVRYPETGHTFPSEQRQEAYRVIDRVLEQDHP